MKKVEEVLELHVILERLEHLCACSLGKEHVYNMKQFEDMDDLNQELSHTSEAMSLYFAYGSVGLGGLHDVKMHVRKAQIDGICQTQDLLDICSHIDVCINVNHYFEQSHLDTPYFKELNEGLVILKSLKKEIERCISREGEVLDHASSTLLKIRRQISSLEASIRNKMNSYLTSHKDYLASDIVTSRNDRYVIPVKMGFQNKVRGIIHAQSASHQTAYIEPEAIVNMNNELQSLRSQEQDEIERILYELSQLVKKDGIHILDNQDILAEIDFLFAKATMAKNLDCVIPTIREDSSYFLLKHARHPLIDQSKVVSNTIEIKEPQHILLITGSNTGGKTVTMKTIGLLSLMSLYGLAIPCREAVIPFFDEIFVDLGDEQSIEQSLSTFSSHMSKLVYITDNITKDSLVLMDEVGSGTDPQEGQSIASALLEYIHGFGCLCVATTHYSSLKRDAKQLDYILLASVAFDKEKFAPTYKLVLGESGSSYAMEISRRLGLKDSIINRALQIKEASQQESEKLLERLEKELVEARKMQELYEQKLEDAKKLEEKWLRRQEVFEKEKQSYLDQAMASTNEMVDKAKKEIEQILADYKEKGKEVKMHETNDARHALDRLKVEKTSEIEKGDPNYNYQVGDAVRVISMDREAEVIEVKKDEVTLNLGGIKMQIKKSDIAYIGKKKKPKIVKTRGATNVKKTGSYEVNVIGMRYEEAMAVVDKFIDDALVTGYPSIRIIHGMGTGALRKGVTQLLKKHKRVTSFRAGGPTEGGIGATIAYFE